MRPPVIGVVTDFVVHAFWIYPTLTGMPSQRKRMRDAMLERGIAAERIHVIRDSCPPALCAAADRNALRERLGLPLDRNIVLMMGGGLGMGAARCDDGALSHIDTPACARYCGRNAAEARVLAAAQALPYPVRVARFVDNVVRIHACGRRARHEARRPHIVGSARRQSRWCFSSRCRGRKSGTRAISFSRRAAVRADGVAGLTRAIGNVLSSGDRGGRLRASMRALRRPDAADAVAERILALAGGGA